MLGISGNPVASLDPATAQKRAELSAPVGSLKFPDDVVAGGAVLLIAGIVVVGDTTHEVVEDCTEASRVPRTSAGGSHFLSARRRSR